MVSKVSVLKLMLNRKFVSIIAGLLNENANSYPVLTPWLNYVDKMGIILIEYHPFIGGKYTLVDITTVLQTYNALKKQLGTL
jgi:hypothetical protein